MTDTSRPGFSPPRLLAFSHDLAPFHGSSPPMVCPFLGLSSDISEAFNLRFSRSPVELIFSVLEGVWLHEPLQGGVLELVGPVFPIMKVGPGPGH